MTDIDTTTSPEIYEWTGPTGVEFVQEKSLCGTYYHRETPQVVRAILDSKMQSRERIRIFLGDTITGKSWGDEWGVLGAVGRSTGEIKIPLLIANSRSYGGPAISDDCIVAIADSPGHFIYRHPKLDLGAWTVGEPKKDGYIEASYRDGAIVGQFKKAGQAKRHCQFMVGERFAK